MEAYHGDEAIKAKYVSRVKAHAEADEIVKGQYWQEGKGCAVGCTIHSGNHAAYETELGMPRWMAKLEDTIFEGLPNARAMKWPLEFLEAIKPGVDLQKCFRPMLIFIVESARETTKNKRSLAAIDGVLVELRKDILDRDALLKARRAAAAAYADAAAAYAADAYAAAYAADAADAAAYAAYADAAAAYAADAYAAAYAADAADAAAYAADAARKATYVKFADKLLELIRYC
jgi:hypothetical protein